MPIFPEFDRIPLFPEGGCPLKPQGFVRTMMLRPLVLLILELFGKKIHASVKPTFSSPPFVCGGCLDQTTTTVDASDLGGGGGSGACPMGTTFGGSAGGLIILNAFPIVPKQKIIYTYISYRIEK